MMGRVGTLVLAGVLLPACASTRLYSGRAPGEVAAGYDERWHPALLFGAVPLAHYDLDALCSNGWAELRIGPDAFTLLSGLVTLFLYSPSRVTVVCAGPSDVPPKAPVLDRPR